MEMGSLDKKTELALRFKQVPFIKDIHLHGVVNGRFQNLFPKS
jgi:hypothetical protein